MHAGMHTAGHAIGSKQCSQRKARRQRLGDRHDVGLNSILLVSEILSGTAQAALDFVKNQQRSSAIAELSRRLQKFRAEWTDATFSLNRLQADRAHATVKLALEVIDIVEADETNAWHEGRERMPVF